MKHVNSLAPKQWTFRETSERWSIAEDIEHLITFEIFIARAIAKAIKGLVEPDKKSRSYMKEPIVLGRQTAEASDSMLGKPFAQ
jgi:hypothetical protein